MSQGSALSKPYFAGAVFVAGFVGVTLGIDLPREARAQNSSATSVILVPPGGLIFRGAADGKPIARLSRDAHGGFLELYDSKQQPALRVPAAAMEPACSPDNTYVDGPEDPFLFDPGDFRNSIDPPCTSRRPGAGF
jgi:hypothetical protein